MVSQATTRVSSKQEEVLKMATVEHNGVIKISPQVSTAYLQISCNKEFVALPATSDEIGIWKVKECDKRVSIGFFAGPQILREK